MRGRHVHWFSGDTRASSWNWVPPLSSPRTVLWHLVGMQVGHLGAHRHSYCYSEMVTRCRGPFIPLPKLNQPTKWHPHSCAVSTAGACGELWVSVGLREGGAGCGSGATVLVTWAAKSLVSIGLCLFFTPSPGCWDSLQVTQPWHPDRWIQRGVLYFCVERVTQGLS